MTKASKENFDIWLKILTLIGSIIAFVFTLITWNEQNQTKRADFLENKIKEFDDTSTLIARSILDDFAICDTINAIAINMSAQEMIYIGSSRIKDSTDKVLDIQLINIGKTLNRDLPDTSISRQKVRLSFDKLLAFFGKLDYYLKLGLMTKKEVEYFTYYIRKCSDNDEIMKYARNNSFNGFLSLAGSMDLLKTK